MALPGCMVSYVNIRAIECAMKVRVCWIENVEFVVETGSGHAIVVDGSESIGGHQLDNPAKRERRRIERSRNPPGLLDHDSLLTSRDMTPTATDQFGRDVCSTMY